MTERRSGGDQRADAERTSGDRLVTLAPELARRSSDRELCDLERYFQPTAVLLTDRLPRAERDRLETTLSVPVVAATEPATVPLDETVLLNCPTVADARDRLARSRDAPIVAMAGFVRQTHDPHTFERTVDGLETYHDLVGGRSDVHAHLTPNLPAGQAIRDGPVPIHGAGFVDGTDGTDGQRIPCVGLGPSPTVEELRPGRLGLGAIHDVGWKLRRRLEERGWTTRADVLSMDPVELLDLEGVGPYYAARLCAGAHAKEHDEVVRFQPDPIAADRRVYVDIETDSLTPQFIWQIGLYDEATGTYRSFVNDERPGAAGANPEGSVVADFAAWVAEAAPDATFVAWYGSQFDFPHLDEFVATHAEPAHRRAWERAERFDLLCEFVRTGVAHPARSNRLEDVAARLGYERAEPGLSGEAAAQAYVAWRNGQAEMEWERWIAYCRDDVLATKHVYDAIADAPLLVDTRELERAYRGGTVETDLGGWARP